jgi:hypothetical protein
LPSRRRSQESSAALYYVGYVSMTPGPSSLSGRNQPSVRLGLSWAASRPAAAGALGWPGGREENEAELGVSFGPNRGAILHFSTSSPTWPPKRIAARAASQRLPRPFGPRQSPVGAKLRNYPENFGRHTGCNTGPPRLRSLATPSRLSARPPCPSYERRMPSFGY